MHILSAIIASLILPIHTPGVRSTVVHQSNLSQTVCVSGYTATIRPPVSYTNPLKLKQLKDWHYTDQDPRDFEEDHFIPLALGGSPTNPQNLWPEPWGQARKTDVTENRLHRELCSGKITLRSAQTSIITWKRANG
jgi:hypothetical protein